MSMEAEVKSSEQDARPSDRMLRGLLWGVLALVIVGILGANFWTFVHQKSSTTSESATSLSELAAHGQLPDFSLTDQLGASFALSDLQDKVWVADFIFTSCGTICPPMTIEMARLQDEFAAGDLHFVSFSVDPEQDTPEALFRYADYYGADSDRWSFLTGQKEAIYQLAQDGFSLAAGHRGSEILHSTRFVLVDRNQQVRGYYDSRSKAHLQQLRQDMQTLLR
ncbi:SCO family protein [Candidatus Poribacteria bacterium]|nr:SCO family protein [Candidatus Poribacteria bacterium]